MTCTLRLMMLLLLRANERPAATVDAIVLCTKCALDLTESRSAAKPLRLSKESENEHVA